jgi:vitamin K-dependent gamma-carboxylase-like protein
MVSGTLRTESAFELEVKSLSVGRIALGLLLLADLGIRATDLTAHYTDQGILPRGAFNNADWDVLWSLHALSGSAAWEALLFAVAALFLGAFTLGYRTFFANIGAWLLTVSLHGRNPFLRDGQDDLARVLLFWMLFLPMGACFSLDARAGRPSHPMQTSRATVLSAGSVGLTLQMLAIYWISVIHKAISPWWSSGDALLYTFSLRRYQTPIAQALLSYPGLLRAGCYLAIAAELVGPALLLVPFNRRAMRIAAVVVTSGLHLVMGLNLRLGLFPLISIAAWLLFLPSFGAPPAPVESPAARQQKWALPARVAVIAALVIVALVNVQNVLQARIPVAPYAARLVGLQQWWGVFAPRAGEGVVDGWYQATALDESGATFDLHTPETLWSADAPKLLTFKSSRWRHSFANHDLAHPLHPVPGAGEEPRRARPLALQGVERRAPARAEAHPRLLVLLPAQGRPTSAGRADAHGERGRLPHRLALTVHSFPTVTRA